MRKAFVDAEETTARVVGRRTQAPEALSTTTSRKADAVAWQRSFGAGYIRSHGEEPPLA